MSEKKDREVRKLFNKANSNAMDMLNNDELSDLTPNEIFIGACKLAVANHEPAPTSYSSVSAEVLKNNVAFMLDQDDAIIILGEQAFEEAMQDLDVGTDVDED